MKKIISIFALFAITAIAQLGQAKSPPAQTEKNEKKCFTGDNNQATGSDASATAIAMHHGGVACDIVLLVNYSIINTLLQITPTATIPAGTLPLRLAVTQKGKHGETIYFKNLSSIPGSAGPKYEGPGSRPQHIKHS